MNQVITPAVGILLAANILGFLVQNVSSHEALLTLFALWPTETRFFIPWQPVTYAFLHANLTHLFFNMFALWMFGSDIERVWGTQRFTFFYFVCVVGAALVQLAVAAYTGGVYPTIGASGGVFGVLLAFGMLFPNRRVVLLIPPIPMKAKYFVLLYGILELWLGVSGGNTGVAHFAHLGGMLFGMVLIFYWRNVRRA